MFNVTKVDGETPDVFFLNIEFFSGKKKSKKHYPKSRIFDCNNLSNLKDKREQVQSRDYPIFIPGFDGMVWVRITKIIGELYQDAVFVPGSDFNN